MTEDCCSWATGATTDGIKEMLERLPPEALPFGVYWLSRSEPACASARMAGETPSGLGGSR